MYRDTDNGDTIDERGGGDEARIGGSDGIDKGKSKRPLEE